MQFLEVRGVSKGTVNETILANISFDQEYLQKIVVAGETGSGKSTLLKIIAGLIQADSGEVIFRGKRVEGPVEKLVPGHPQIAYLSQHFELAKFLRVEQVLHYANSIEDEKAKTIFELCQIDHLLQRKTDQLSGGERQRIALAKLLISSPQLLLLDEPFSNLDIIHKNTLKVVIENIGSELAITSILVSHDSGDTLSWADRILVLRAGKIVQLGPPSEIYERPANEYIAGLFGKFNLLTDGQRDLLLPGLMGKIMVRPEAVKLEKNHNGRGYNAVVENVKFFGPSMEVRLRLLDAAVIAMAPPHKVKPGDRVWIELDRENIFVMHQKKGN